MDKHNMLSDDFYNSDKVQKKMNVKDQLLSMIIGSINLIIIALIGYAYLSDKANAAEKIVTEKTERIAADEAIKSDLDKKVDKDSFNEFKQGQKEIRDYINESNKREIIYQDIIRRLSFLDIDTVGVEYEKITIHDPS